MEQAKWIWLNGTEIPREEDFYVAEFCRQYKFDKELRSVTLNVTADTFFHLWLNESTLGRGPHCPGGDYDGTCMFGTKPGSRVHYRGVMPVTLLSTFSTQLSGTELRLWAAVRFGKMVFTDVSVGKGGFFLEGTVFFQDGSTQTIGTDHSWQGRRSAQRIRPELIDYTQEQPPFLPAAEVVNIWNVKKTEIPNLSENMVLPFHSRPITVAPEQKTEIFLDFDTVYSGYPFLNIRANGKYRIVIKVCETYGCWKFTDTIYGDSPRHYEMLRMCGVGGLLLEIENLSDTELLISEAGLRYVRYPVTKEGTFRCSDHLLERIYDAGKHALEICRQSIHLDSPAHQENLGCTGDYYIESLAEYFAFGDTALTRFDLLRTADLLRQGDGRMFHTSYSLIFLQMLWDYYQFSGDRYIFSQVLDAIELLMDRFSGYEAGELIENPPDYVFVDWLEVDGYSLHHPPKALGQTVLNGFYYKALLIVRDIYHMIGNRERSQFYSVKADKMRVAFQRRFFDREAGLFLNGATESIDPEILNQWQPENPPKKYFSVHANVLAILYGLCPQDQARSIMERVLSDSTLIQPQPYFMHFVLEAVWKCGLFEQHGLHLLRRWENALGEKPQTLKEGWIKVNEYGFDLSHAWAASPTYQIPSKLLGLSMLEPGYRKITLAPRLYGLEYVELSIPTPYGYIRCKMARGEQTVLEVPEQIDYRCE